MYKHSLGGKNKKMWKLFLHQTTFCGKNRQTPNLLVFKVEWTYITCNYGHFSLLRSNICAIKFVYNTYKYNRPDMNNIVFGH